MADQDQVRNLLETIKADTAVPDAIKRQAEETLNQSMNRISGFIVLS